MLVGFQQTQLSDGRKARCKIFHAFVVCWEEKGCLAGLGSLTLPPLPVAPDCLQRTLLVSRGPHLQGPGGDPAAARCAHLRRGGPAHRVPGFRRYQISSWATRFMRSAAAALSGFCAMRSKQQRLASRVARETVTQQRGARRPLPSEPSEPSAAPPGPLQIHT